MRDMTLSPLAIQLGIAAILVLSIAVSTLSFCAHIAPGWRRADDSSDLRKLKPGWYQLQIVVTNRALWCAAASGAADGADPAGQHARRRLPGMVRSNDRQRASEFRSTSLLGRMTQAAAAPCLPRTRSSRPGCSSPLAPILPSLCSSTAAITCALCRFSVATSPENVSTHDDASRRT